MKKGIIKACFPLHAPYAMDTFRAQWMQYPFRSIPLEVDYGICVSLIIPEDSWLNVINVYD